MESSVLDAEAIARIVRRIASEIVERTSGSDLLAFIGIRHGGVPIAARLAKAVSESQQVTAPVGAIDMTLYRDDAGSALLIPKVGPDEIMFDINGREIVLVDDVLQTGRTVRAAIESLLAYGRPRRIWLAVLCDRGERELPIAADFVGREIDVPHGFVLDVVAEGGAGDRVLLRKKAAP
jgi:pyrimidine operon attenuation protein/uracil phosphoribosyltransferase